MATQKEIDAVWAKGKPIRGEDPNVRRTDAYGNQIYKPAYGKQGPQSWEIDHELPTAKGGPDTLPNKQPLQTDANRQKSDKIVPRPIKRL